MTLEQSIKHFASLTPDKTAAVCGADSISYARLWQEIEQRARSLAADGLQPHRPYVYRANQDIDFLVTYCAVHLAGGVAVPLEHGASDSHMADIRAEVESCTFADDIVDALYTTGTTGKAKGVMLSARALESCAENFIDAMEYDSDLMYIVSGPLNHIATLFKIHPVLAVGGSIAILDGLKDMNAFFDVFDLPFKKFATFLVPASIRMILQFAADKLAAVSNLVDFIETGAAPISSADMKKLSGILPHSRLYNTLGGTEIGAVCTYNFNDGLYMEGCIGRPMKNSTVEIAGDGHLVISGPTIMSGYAGDPQTTAQVIVDGKIHSSDIGYVDGNGLIHLSGRKGDVINVGGFKVNPVEVENAAQSHPSVKDCVCIAAQHPVIGTVLELLVVLADGCALDRTALARHIAALLVPHKVPTYYRQVDAVNRTYNGKIDRKSYMK